MLCQTKAKLANKVFFKEYNYLTDMYEALNHIVCDYNSFMNSLIPKYGDV